MLSILIWKVYCYIKINWGPCGVSVGTGTSCPNLMTWIQCLESIKNLEGENYPTKLVLWLLQTHCDITSLLLFLLPPPFFLHPPTPLKLWFWGIISILVGYVDYLEVMLNILVLLMSKTLISLINTLLERLKWTAQMRMLGILKSKCEFIGDFILL